MSWDLLITKKTAILALVLISGLTWFNSITSEFSGYDDIALIAHKGKVHNGPLAAADFYLRHPSISQNGAWSNQPNFIYRPLEWIGSAIGYSIWGANPVLFHIFFNYLFHIINTILVFFILTKVFNGNLLVATVSSAIWTVHPLHNEAINMLTSGVGFLWATFFALVAFLINIHSKNYSNYRDWVLLIFAMVSLFIAYLGSEMAIITAPCLSLYYLYEKQAFRQAIDWIRVAASWLTVLAYFSLRNSVLNEAHAWTAGFTEIFERVFVLAPEIFFHYIKLYFYPKILTVDQHHQVILSDFGTSYHWLALACVGCFIYAIVYFMRKQEYLIAYSSILTFLSLGIVLNIIPLYVLARERYCYIFTLALTVFIVSLIEKYFYRDQQPSIQRNRIFTLLVLVVVVALSARSIIRNQDWQNGERLWTSTIINSKQDLALVQLWSASLLDYYNNPGTKTFKTPLDKLAKLNKQFNNFIVVNNLNKAAVLNRIKLAHNALENKYGFTGVRSMASAIYVTGKAARLQGDIKLAFEIFKLGHLYYPEHFLINEELVLILGPKNPAINKLFDLMDKEALHNPYLARQLVKLAFRVRSIRFHEFARKYQALNPSMLDLNVNLFNSLYISGRFHEAYALAKEIRHKYKEDDTIDNFIKQYEAARYTSKLSQ